MKLHPYYVVLIQTKKLPNFFDEKPQTLRVLNECFPCYFCYRLLFDVINVPCPQGAQAHYFTELCVFIDLWGQITIEKYYSSHNPQKKLADQQQVLCRFINFESLSNLTLLASILVTAIERSGISGSQKSFLQETVNDVNDGRKVWATVLFLSAIMQRKVTHVNFFLPFLQDHGLLT